MNTEGLSKRSKWSYVLGGIGRDMAYNLFSGFLLSYILFTKHLTDSQFATISLILVVCRIWDGINDPIMGGIIEITRTKMGKFKPWILLGVFTNAVILVTMFSLKVEGGGFIAMFAILYLLWDLTYTMNDIGYWAMLPALTSVPKERANVTTLANLFAGVGAILTMGLVPLFTAGDLTIGGNAIIAYAVIAIICAAAFIGCQMLTVFGVKENHQPSTEKGEPTKFKKLFKIIFRNKQLLWITLVMLLFNLGRFLIMGFATTFVYLQFGYAGMYATIVVLIYALPNIFVNIVYPAIAKKFTRKQIEIISTVISVVGYVLLFALGFNFIALCAAILLLSTGQTLFYVLLTIALSNTVEYNEWKYGSRDEGIIFSLRPFMSKFGTALQQLVIMVVFLMLGILNFTNQISDIENLAKAGSITSAEKTEMIENVINSIDPSITTKLRFWMAVIPVVLLIAAFFIFRTRFIIDEKYYDQMIKEIAERKNAEAK